MKHPPLGRAMARLGVAGCLSLGDNLHVGAGYHHLLSVLQLRLQHAHHRARRNLHQLRRKSSHRRQLSEVGLADDAHMTADLQHLRFESRSRQRLVRQLIVVVAGVFGAARDIGACLDQIERRCGRIRPSQYVRMDIDLIGAGQQVATLRVVTERLPLPADVVLPMLAVWPNCPDSSAMDAARMDSLKIRHPILHADNAVRQTLDIEKLKL